MPVAANADGSQPHLQYTDQFITGDIDTTYATGANFSNIDNAGGSLTLDYSVSDSLAIKSITAYRELDSTFGLDIDGSPLAFDQTSFIMQTEQLSQEFQFTGSAGDMIDYTAGLYYFEEDGYQADRVPIAGGLIQVSGDWDHDTEAYAVFGELNFNLTDSIAFVLGGRYTDEERTLVLRQQNLNTDFAVGGRDLALLPVPSDPSLLGPADPLTVSFTNTSIRAGVNWQLTDDAFTYLTYSEGFKSGGFTTRLTDYFSEALIALADPNDPAVLRSLEYDPETAENIELGFKTSFGNRARLNGAVFFNSYDDIQIVVQRGVSPSNENVAKAEIKGLELELEVYPVDSLAVTATLGYLDAEYTDFDPVAQALLIDRFGNRIDESTSLANTPELTASLALNLTLSDNWSVNLNGSYTDDVYNDVFNTEALAQDSYVLTNASIRFDSADEQWNAIAGVTNLSDERYIVSGFEARSLPFTTASYNRPREWYFSLGYNF
jgi:iron complex outermembrane receptor protein